jgi:predicted Zn finger-like uncharacterized protein
MKPSDQATRCPACKTVFRVVADQLRVSEGWVRCGRCTNVFSATENMVDMDGGWARIADVPVQEPPAPPPRPWPSAHDSPHRARQDGHDGERLATKIEAAMSRALLRSDAPGPAGAPSPYAAPPAAASTTLSSGASALTFRRPVAGPPSAPLRSSAEAQEHAEAPWDGESAENWPTAAEVRTGAPEAAPEPAPGWARAPQPAAPSQAPARPQTTPGLGPGSPMFDATTPESSWPAPESSAGLEGLRAEPRRSAPVPATAKPGFMRQAERNQQWRQPRMRALLVSALAGSALLLLAQVGVVYRDLAAARFPALKPVLEGLCAGLGCTVQAARALDGLAVESSGLIQVEKTPQYRLQVTLRNRAGMELALPALDVTFTDSRGEVISRKVLLPQELGSTIDPRAGSHGGVVAAGREVTLQGTLQASTATAAGVSGYTVELFYP